MFSGGLGYSQVGERFNPEVGFLPRRAYRRAEGRYAISYQPKRWPWIRRIQSTRGTNVYVDLDNRLESSNGHLHFFDIQTQPGGRFSCHHDRQQDRPTLPFTVYQDVTGRRVVIPAGEYAVVHRGAGIRIRPSAPISSAAHEDRDLLRWRLPRVGGGARVRRRRAAALVGRLEP